MTWRRAASRRAMWVGSSLPLVLAGCDPQVEPAAPFLSRAEAIDRVVENSAGARDRRLYVKGNWSGYLTDGAGERLTRSGRFSMHVALPARLSFKDRGDALGLKVFEAGCNESVLWYWQKYPDDQDHLKLADRSGATVASEDMPVPPDALLDALGLGPFDGPAGGSGPRYRVEADYNQLFYDGSDDAEVPFILKEVWLDRRAPHLVRRVLYRDPDGRIVLDARLSDHGPARDADIRVARKIRLEMPLVESGIELSISDVLLRDDRDHPAFLDPRSRFRANPMEPEPGPVVWLTDPPPGIPR